MSSVPTAAFRRAVSANPARRLLRPSRSGRSRTLHYFRRGRDPRRFGRAQAWLIDPTPAAAPLASDNLRLFAHSFGAAFLFVSVLIA